jgi:hypothetical protein
VPEGVDSEWGAGLIGYLLGDADEAVARRREPVWTRLDKPTKTFLLSYNDYTENDLGPALAAMKTALDDGTAIRVVVDMRYIRGGNGGLAAPLIDALKTDKRVNRAGGLTVLIGRENASAGTVVAGALDRETQAVLIGEPTPARADNFLCECMDITLRNTPWVVSIPTQFLANGDKRDAVLPDVPITLTAADFFAGRDPALALALAGSAASPRPSGGSAEDRDRPSVIPQTISSPSASRSPTWMGVIAIEAGALIVSRSPGGPRPVASTPRPGVRRGRRLTRGPLRAWPCPCRSA